MEHGRDVSASGGRSRRARPVAAVRLLLVVLSLATAGCGDAEAGGTAAPATAAAATTVAWPTTSTVVAGTEVPASMPATPVTTPADPGTGCRAELRGARVAQVQRPPGPNAAATSLWFDTAELVRTGFAAPGRAGLTVNCDDRDATVNLLLSAGTPAAALVPGPGRYPIAASGAPGTFALLVALAGDPRVWTVTAGEVVLTAHDTHRLTGTFTATLVDAFGGGAAAATLAIAGRFDQPCAVGARCGH